MDFDRQSMTSTGRGGRVFERPGSDIRKTGYLKKLKTMKKKFFVLRSTSSSGPARLEYVDSEKKFRASAPPKRSIQLHTCFNINKKTDNRNCKHGIALYTSEDCFVVLAESEEDQDAWFSIMLEYQNEYLPDGDMHKEHFEHVWQVTLQPKNLGKAHKGSYRLCLNSTTVCMVKTSLSKPQFTIQLVTIRQVAFNDCTFRIEVGKYAPTGEGEFWFNVEDQNTAKDMHATLLHYMNSVKEPSIKKEQFRTRSESHSSMSPNRHRPSKVEQRPQSFYTPPNAWHGLDATSPVGNPPYQSHIGSFELAPGPHRPRSDTGDSRHSRGSSQFEDASHEIIATYDGDLVDDIAIKDDKQHITIVPEDMSPPPSPSGLDEEINDYLGMDLSTHSSTISTPPASNSSSSAYLAMNLSMSSQFHSQEPSPSIDSGYIPLGGPSVLSHSPPSSIPVLSHGYGEGHHMSHSSHPAHPTYPPPLPTVKEGGSNEGYLPMDISNSPSSSSIPRPDPAKCMLSDDTSGLPPRTYSLGSKPVGKKYAGYMDMAPRKGSVGNDMSRAISAPHIINKGRRDRDREHHVTDSPTPSPLSMSVKSDDSDSFMEYMPMRPRTSSDSFNYRPRTSSFGKLQSHCRPRSSSHGQGTRPFTKLIIEQARISQDPMQRISRESSIHGSFDSLRVSNESLRRMSQESRHSPLVSEHDDHRGSPPLIGKNGKNDSYVNMDVSSGQRKSSPHRVRTDSSGSGRRSDKMSSSERSLHSQDNSNYTEMAPIGARVSEGDGYMSMGFTTTSRPGLSTSLQSSRVAADSSYMSMEVAGESKGSRSNSIRSASVENVDSYISYDPAPMGNNKPRTGSLGSKDKKVTQGLKKSASHHQPSVSASTRKGGSSDSLRKTARQSSMEKYGSLGKDFRKKSGSTGSRPVSARNCDILNSANILPLRNLTSRTSKDEPADEYIEFSPTAVIGENDSVVIRSSGSFSSYQSRAGGIPHGSSMGFVRHSYSHPNTHIQSIPPQNDDSTYTMYSPGAPPSSSHHSSNASDDSSYMPFAPAPQPLTRSPHRMHDNFFAQRLSHPNTSSHSQVKQISAKEVPEYVGFDPRPGQHPPVIPNLGIQPTTAVSYIMGESNTGSNPKLKNLKVQHSSLDSSKHAPRQERKAGSTSPGLTMSTSLTFEPPSFYSADSFHTQQHPQPPNASSMMSTSSSQLLKSESASSQGKGTVGVSKDMDVSRDDSGYIECSPATHFPESSTKGQLTPLTSLIGQNNDSKMDSKQSSSKGNSRDVKNCHEDISNNKMVPLIPPSEDSLKMQEKQVLQQQKQPQYIQKQPCAPLVIASDSQVTSSDQKGTSSPSPHSSSPSPQVSENTPPWTGSRHKHLSGSSNTSQKSRRISGESDKSLKKGSKSDSNSSLSSSGGRSKRRVPSGEKSPGANSDKGPLSPLKGDEFSWSGHYSGKSLEAKMVPMEAKIRHSLGDVTDGVEGAGKKESGCQGLIRPGSTPCIQHLDSSADKSSLDSISALKTSHDSHVTSRSRHSLSDLGTYQQIASGGSSCPLSPNIAENTSSNSDTSLEQPKKILNYAQLDLSYPLEGEGESKCSKVKSKTSLDSDDKEPPLSYAKIDFEKCQNMKTLALDGAQEGTSKT